MPPYSRLERDVNLTEEEELRRLESGAADDEPPADLLCTARAVRSGSGLGTLSLFSDRFEFTPDDPAGALVRVELRQVQRLQLPKPGVQKAKLKIVLKPAGGADEGGAHIFDFTSSSDLSGSIWMAQRDLICDSLEGRLRALGLVTGGGSAASNSGGATAAGSSSSSAAAE